MKAYSLSGLYPNRTNTITEIPVESMAWEVHREVCCDFSIIETISEHKVATEESNKTGGNAEGRNSKSHMLTRWP